VDVENSANAEILDSAPDALEQPTSLPGDEDNNVPVESGTLDSVPATAEQPKGLSRGLDESVQACGRVDELGNGDPTRFEKVLVSASSIGKTRKYLHCKAESRARGCENPASGWQPTPERIAQHPEPRPRERSLPSVIVNAIFGGPRSTVRTMWLGLGAMRTKRSRMGGPQIRYHARSDCE
jgi:hypothetical protein